MVIPYSHTNPIVPPKSKGKCPCCHGSHGPAKAGKLAQPIDWAPGSGGWGITFLGPTGLKWWERQFLAGYYPQSTAQTETHHQFSCEKDLLSEGFSLRGRLQVYYLEGTEVLSGYTSLDLATAHWYLPERSSSGTPIFCNSYEVDNSRLPGLAASRVYICGPTGLNTFA